MTLRQSIGFAWVISAALLMLTNSAAGMGGQGGGAAVVIDSVQFFDLPGGKKNIEILGGGLTSNSGLPVVTLDGVIELDVLEASISAISVNVPKNTPDGDYLLMVSTGSTSKENDAIDIHLGGTISIVCIDWYLTTGPNHHIHAEGFLQDENGDSVIGAAVHWESFVDGVQWYDYNTTTFMYAGYNHGESCPIEVAQASGATGQNCCIGSATDPPDDSRSCDSGFYEVEVIAVQAPPGSDRKWDGITPLNGREFVQP